MLVASPRKRANCCGRHLRGPQAVDPRAAREQLENTVESIKAVNGEAIGIQADVRSSAAMKSAVEAFGAVDILRNNAGVCIVEAVDKITDQSLEAAIDVNSRDYSIRSGILRRS